MVRLRPADRFECPPTAMGRFNRGVLRLAISNARFRAVFIFRSMDPLLSYSYSILVKEYSTVAYFWNGHISVPPRSTHYTSFGLGCGRSLRANVRMCPSLCLCPHLSCALGGQPPTLILNNRSADNFPILWKLQLEGQPVCEGGRGDRRLIKSVSSQALSYGLQPLQKVVTQTVTKAENPQKCSGSDAHKGALHSTATMRQTYCRILKDRGDVYCTRSTGQRMKFYHLCGDVV